MQTIPNPRVTEDLATSGLTISDIAARAMTAPEKAATNTPYSIDGYVIPYFDMVGKPASFYRVKLFDFDVKYKQPKETPNHVYFPRGWKALADNSPYIILTEGEKKAALGVKLGIPVCALGGVDSWRNRVVTLPKGVELNQDNQKIRAKLPSGEDLAVMEDYLAPLALGIQDLIDYILQHKKILIIIFDTDNMHGTNTNVQRAAASLGFELRFRGVPFASIRQIALPLIPGHTKTGLDDYIMHAPEGSIQKLIARCLEKPSAFPRHPNIRDYLNKRLQKTKLSRKEIQQIAMAVLADLDAHGRRLYSAQESQAYYFDNSVHKLHKVNFLDGKIHVDSDFGRFMYEKYGLGTSDNRAFEWIGTMFIGEQPLSSITPYRVFARKSLDDDSVNLQISDGEYVHVSKDGCNLRVNGSDQILFEAGHVTSVDTRVLMESYRLQMEAYANEPIPSWWMDVLTEVRLKDRDKQRCITALLFYVAPWLYRWRGTQLPVEMTLGEAGSGKSTLQELRLLIQTGDPRLRNTPQDLKDWYASVTNSGGLHVTDNVQLMDASFRQKLSDELCRLVTETDPHIEQRKYYTNADLVRIPVSCVFGITAIKQPFLNQDILQRSVLIELDKAQDIVDGTLTYDMAWKEQQLSRFGGRAQWLAHHLVVLTKFFRLVEQKWNRKYLAKHRLINFEQALVLMAEVFGLNASWIPDYLTTVTNLAVTDADQAFEGLVEFGKYWQFNILLTNPNKVFGTQEISNWAQGNPDYEKCELLINTRKLGRYMRTHKTMIATTAHIYEAGSSNNRQVYKIS